MPGSVALRNAVMLQSMFHNFNIFRIREKQIPIDIVELKGEPFAGVQHYN